jgi:pimeloyl-ACP methyl ester carboxylesterase
MPSARVIRADGVELASESFGDRHDPTILLIMGTMASMLWWPDGFCARLADRRRHVVRYDHRDTGLSTTYPLGEPPYTGSDMAADALRILDGYGVASAHLVGMSMGGALAQLVALGHPERTRSLTVISSSPIGEDTSHLPGASTAYRKHAAQAGEIDWSDRAEAVRAMVAESRVLSGSAHPFDEASARRLIERDFDRARSYASMTNHSMLKDDSGPQYRSSALRVPLLVIHGTADPLFPVEHGEALANMVPGATLVRIADGGHELHEADWGKIIAAIVTHTGHRA